MPNKKASDAELKSVYAETGNVWRTAEQFGMCGQSVWERLKKLGVNNARREFTQDQRSLIRVLYERDFVRGELKSFCRLHGLLPTSVARWARDMGWTNGCRGQPDEVRASASRRFKNWHLNHDHPKGMLGKKHSQEALRKMSAASVRSANSRTLEQKSAIGIKGLKTRIARYGTPAQPRANVSWKQQWRSIGGRRIFFRSSWEVIYAEYLQSLKEFGQIAEWEYEAETFCFSKASLGGYTPDFRITFPGGLVEFHEVKGWMDDRSRAKLNAMDKEHPNVILRLIDKKWFKNRL